MLQVHLREDDESFRVKDEHVAALGPNHQAADPILIGGALLQSADAGDDRLKQTLLLTAHLVF